MSTIQTKNLVTSIREAKNTLSGLSGAEKKKLEKSWDVEHAYYSSALEGSKIDKKEFEELGKKVK